MLKIFRDKKGQGISAEYVFLITLVSVAIVGMTIYVRRSLQARIRVGNRMVYGRAADAINGMVLAEYEPYYVNSSAASESNSEQTQTVTGNLAWEQTTNTHRNLNSLSAQRPF